jgi:DNA repair exonuclease SbcCD nuclease subunit
MSRISLVHCADLHLDAPFTGLGSSSLSRQRRVDLKECFQKIISFVLEKNADYLVISGDLYEHRYVTVSTIHWLNGQFARLGERQVVLVPGNHDPYVSNSWYKSFSWSSNVHILTTNSPEYFDEAKGVYFYGIGFDTFRQERLPEIPPPSAGPDRINICLFHGTLDMAFTQSPYNPIDLNTLLELGLDYYALGHFHGTNAAYTDLGVINCGSPEPLGFDEPGQHGVYWVTLEKQNGNISRDIQFIRLQKRFYREMLLDITGCSSGFKLQKLLEDGFDWDTLREDILRVKLTGRIPSGAKPDLHAAEEFLQKACFHAQLIDLTEPAYDLDMLAADNNIAGVFVRNMREKIEKAGGEEKRLLEKAMQLGLDALLHGSLELHGQE